MARPAVLLRRPWVKALLIVWVIPVLYCWFGDADKQGEVFLALDDGHLRAGWRLGPHDPLWTDRLYGPDAGSWTWNRFHYAAVGGARPVRRLGLPTGFLDVAVLTPYLAWGWALSWARRRLDRLPRRTGRCARCGYDLRATPERCPECGAVP